MVVSEQEATKFIHDYTQLMLEVCGPVRSRPKRTLLQVLAQAREKYVANRSLLSTALRALDAKSIDIAPEVVAAVKGLELKKWIYLRDTASYSIFIDPTGAEAYCVFGLTERVRNIVGGSGAVIETALLPYCGRYITDGIVSNVLWLGPNYKREFTELLGELRAQGRLYRTHAS